MSLKTPLYLENGSYAASDDRSIFSLFNPGVIAAGDFAVTQRGAGLNMSVDVAAGSAIVAGTDVAGQGNYLVESTATYNVPIAAAPGAGNSRIDLIVLFVRDSEDEGLNNDFLPFAVTGTAGSSPSAPAQPTSSLLLETVHVGTSVTTITNANITDNRVRATSALSSGLGYVAGHLASNLPLPVNEMTPVLSTPTLAPGKWRIDFDGTIAPIDNGGTDGAAQATVTSGAAMLEGSLSAVAPFIAAGDGIASDEYPLPLTFIATVTVAAVITFSMICAGTSGGTAVASSDWSNATLTNLTGFTGQELPA